MEPNQGLSVPQKRPNRETRETFEKTDRGEDLVYSEDADDMFKKLDI